MQLSIELTQYPLQDGYRAMIRETVAQLNSYAGIRVRTFPTASIVIGDYDRVMEVLKDIVAWSYNQHGKCVFIAKILPDYEAE